MWRHGSASPRTLSRSPPYLILGHATYSATYLADRMSASDQAKTIVANKACRSARRVSIVARSASMPRLNVHIHNRPVDRRRTPPDAPVLNETLLRRQRRSSRLRLPHPIPRHRETIRRSLALVRAALRARNGPAVRIQLDGLSRPRPRAAPSR